MLKTHRTFSENVLHFYLDEEVEKFLSDPEGLKNIYEEMIAAKGLATVYPLVMPQSQTEYEFDLMLIVKQVEPTAEGQWEIFVAQNFVILQTNLQAVFSYIEITTKSEAIELVQNIQKELKDYREQFNLAGKTFLEIDANKKIIAFGKI